MKNQRKRQLLDYSSIILVAAVLPLLVYVHIYTFDCGEVAWFDSKTICSDVFSYGKSIFFCLVCTVMLWNIISNRLVQTEKYIQTSTDKLFYLLILLAVLQILSVFFSLNKKIALWGGYQHFEGTFVLIGYIILCFYVYIVTKKHKSHHYIVIPLAIASIIMAIPGFFQVLFKDPFLYPFVQKILLPLGHDSEFISTLTLPKAYMTLANPNTASVYLSMVIPVLFMGVFTYKKWQRIVCTTALLFDLVVLIFTDSRVGVFSLTLVTVLGIMRYKKHGFPHKKAGILAIFSAFLLCVLSNALMSTKTISLGDRIQATFRTSDTNAHQTYVLTTKDDGIHIRKNSQEYILTFDSDGSFYDTLTISDSTKKVVTDTVFSLETGTFLSNDWSDISITEVNMDNEPFLMIEEKHSWFFTRDKNGGYLLYTGSPVYDKITPVESCNFHGFEYFASNRGYIWSRALPLLKKYGLLGCGADNFVLAYPQNDYIGKAQYCKTPLTIIEKAHNGYLQLAIQNGIPALVVFLVFYILYLKTMLTDKTKNSLIGVGSLLGTISYMTGLFFNDSGIHITPLFFILIGISLGERSTS